MAFQYGWIVTLLDLPYHGQARLSERAWPEAVDLVGVRSEGGFTIFVHRSFKRIESENTNRTMLEVRPHCRLHEAALRVVNDRKTHPFCSKPTGSYHRRVR